MKFTASLGLNDDAGPLPNSAAEAAFALRVKHVQYGFWINDDVIKTADDFVHAVYELLGSLGFALSLRWTP
jgi:hypothetical protein